MEALSYSSLQEAYQKALELDLNDDFIVMIEHELSKRTTTKSINTDYNKIWTFNL